MDVLFEDAPIKEFVVMVTATIPGWVARQAIEDTRSELDGKVNKISAIKAIRKELGTSTSLGIHIGLRDAKEMVEAIMSEPDFEHDRLPF
tara:strand:+ start:2696 stop:2965 length:270 start_codon:yes stop_codon:yes gene_type:complete